MNITIHRGTDQIGGSVTEYECGGWRLFVDYGEPLPGRPEPEKSLDIDGLTYGDLSKSALFITHYHDDHIGMVSRLSDQIPIYMGEAGRALYRILKRKLSFLPSSLGEVHQKMLRRTELFSSLRHGEVIEFGPFSVIPYLMDHSAFDAYAFLITCSDGTRALHTGDFRGHGLETSNFHKTLETLDSVDVIVCEGTNIARHERNAIPESVILKMFRKEFFNHKYNFVFVSSTNIQRIFLLYQAAIESGREFVIDSYQFQIMKRAAENDKTNLTTQFKSPMVRKHLYQLDWEGLDSNGDFIINTKLRKLLEIRGFCMLARTTPRFVNFMRTFPPSESQNYLSMWKGYIEPQNIAYNQILADAVGSGAIYIHTSGHADVNTLQKLFSTVKHKFIIPMHTDNPRKFLEYFGSNGLNICLLEDGEVLPVREYSETLEEKSDARKDR